jgi:uncharacterized protein with HEPN domain
MRPERLSLTDIVEAADAVAGFIGGLARESFEGNDLLRSAVLHKLMLIGEAAARLPAEFKSRHPEVPWSDVVAFRNIAVHEYFAVDWVIVWNAATIDAPGLRRLVAAILEREFGPGA